MTQWNEGMGLVYRQQEKIEGYISLFQTHTDHNRTMLFQVGRTDLRLISPDRKQILMHKQLRDVASCIQVLMDCLIAISC
jgi:hypothetical protein